MPEISVIVPVYNVEKYIHRCVDSILTQTFTDFELILVDDGSTDRSGIICDEYEKTDSRIRVIHQRNCGQAVARNTAIRHALAQWIHFVDGDDEVHPRILETLYHAACKYNVEMTLCGAEQGSDEGRLHNWCDFMLPPKTEEVLVDEDALIRYYNDPGFRYGTVWASLIRKSIVEEIPFSDGRIYEDAAVVCQWLCRAGTVVDVLENMYFYRRTQTSTTGSQFSLKRLDVLWAKEVQMSFFDQMGYWRMKGIKAESYIYSAAEFCKEIRKQNEAPRLLCKLKQDILKTYILNRNILHIPKQKCLIILDNLFPRTMNVYWQYVRLKEVITKNNRHVE